MNEEKELLNLLQSNCRYTDEEMCRLLGKELGSAFQGIGKAGIKSAKYSAQKAEAWAEKDDNAAQSPSVPTDTTADTPAETQAQESNVFRDGTWRKAGKGLAHALKDLGSTVLDTVDNALDPKSPDNEEKKD